MAKFHTVPNQVSVDLVEMAGRHVGHCVIVRRDGKTLAIYPAAWGNNRIPTFRELYNDFRWHKPEREFRNVSIGERFKFLPSSDGFWKDHNTYKKTSRTQYRMVLENGDLGPLIYTVGSTKAKATLAMGRV